MKTSKLSLTISFILLTLGISMIVFSFFYKSKYERFMETAISCDATIIDVTTVVKGESKSDEHHIKLSYTVNGTNYTNQSNDWDDSMKEGKTITIYYNPEDPNEIVTYATDYNDYILIILGIIITLAFSINFIKGLLNNNRISKLISTGIKVEANINSLYSDPTFSEAEQIYILNCSYTDPSINKEYVFSVSGITLKMKKYLEKKNIITIPVYYNPKNNRDYFVDYTILQQKKK